MINKAIIFLLILAIATMIYYGELDKNIYRKNDEKNIERIMELERVIEAGRRERQIEMDSFIKIIDIKREGWEVQLKYDRQRVEEISEELLALHSKVKGPIDKKYTLMRICDYDTAGNKRIYLIPVIRTSK